MDVSLKGPWNYFSLRLSSGKTEVTEHHESLRII
jgi:hypothetical protein